MIPTHAFQLVGLQKMVCANLLLSHGGIVFSNLLKFLLSTDESTRTNYLKRLNTPPLSTETCNATANYAGSLPDDLICFEDANSKDNNTKCQINVSFNRFGSDQNRMYNLMILFSLL